MSTAEKSTTIAEVIIYCSPFLAAFSFWVLHELYSGIKGDLKEVKNSNSNIRTDVAKLSVQQKATDDKVTTVCKSMEGVQKMVHEIDKRTANVTELNGAVKSLSERIDRSDKKYGDVLMILDGIAVKLGLKVRRSGS